MSPSAANAYNTDRQERLALYRLYYTLLKCVVCQECTPVLISARNAPQLQEVNPSHSITQQTAASHSITVSLDVHKEP